MSSSIRRHHVIVATDWFRQGQAESHCAATVYASAMSNERMSRHAVIIPSYVSRPSRIGWLAASRHGVRFTFIRHATLALPPRLPTIRRQVGWGRITGFTPEYHQFECPMHHKSESTEALIGRSSPSGQRFMIDHHREGIARLSSCTTNASSWFCFAMLGKCRHVTTDNSRQRRLNGNAVCTSGGAYHHQLEWKVRRRCAHHCRK